MKISRLSGCEAFVGEYSYFEVYPMRRPNGKPAQIRKMRAGGTFRLVVCNNASSKIQNALQLGEITSRYAGTDVIQSRLY